MAGKEFLGPSDVLRGLNPKKFDNGNKFNDIHNTASFKAENLENTTAVSIMLNDFAQNIDDVEHSSYIKSKRFGSDDYTENIYAYREANWSIDWDYDDKFRQDNIFEEEVAQNDGIKYADENDDIIQAALNFAKADIASIEKSHNMAYKDNIMQGALNSEEIEGTYVTSAFYTNNVSHVLSDLRLDVSGKTNGFSAEEYASYMIAMDGLIKDKKGNVCFDENAIDGLVSFDNQTTYEALKGKEVLMETASKIYQENFHVEEKLNVFDVFLRDVFGIEPKSKKNS